MDAKNFNSKKVKQIVWDSAEEVNDSSLEEWYSFHPEVRDDFSKIQIGYNFPQSTLVSAGDFQQDQSKEILRGFSGINDSSIIISDTLIEWQLVNTYAIPAYVHNWVIKKFEQDQNLRSRYVPRNYQSGQCIQLRNQEFVLEILEDIDRKTAMGNLKGKTLVIHLPIGINAYQKHKLCSTIISRIMASFFQSEISKRAVSYTHLRTHETVLDLVCRLLLEKKKKQRQYKHYTSKIHT